MTEWQEIEDLLLEHVMDAPGAPTSLYGQPVLEFLDFYGVMNPGAVIYIENKTWECCLAPNEGLYANAAVFMLYDSDSDERTYWQIPESGDDDPMRKYGTQRQVRPIAVAATRWVPVCGMDSSC